VDDFIFLLVIFIVVIMNVELPGWLWISAAMCTIAFASAVEELLITVVEGALNRNCRSILDIKTMKVYSTMLDSLSNRKKICGFISGGWN